MHLGHMLRALMTNTNSVFKLKSHYNNYNVLINQTLWEQQNLYQPLVWAM